MLPVLGKTGATFISFYLVTPLGQQSQPAYGGSQKRLLLHGGSCCRPAAPPPAAPRVYAGADRGAGGPSVPGGAAAHLGQEECTRC